MEASLLFSLRNFSSRNVSRCAVTLKVYIATPVSMKEKEYIAAAIDDAMAEMGYAVLGHKDIKKKSGKHIKKALYQFGDGTVINVSSTSDGQISMELGAIDYIDRTPTQTEAKNLCKEMQQFCGDFTEIEKCCFIV